MSGDLKWNKVFGAGLATVLAIVVVQQGSDMLFATEQPEKMGYFIDAPEVVAAGAVEVELAPDWGTVIPVADLAAGERAFARCASCHSITPGGANGIGPALHGVVGRAVGAHPGFAYSEAMTGHRSTDPVWSLDALDGFITAPAKYVEGTKMSFAGLRNTEERVALIAYLRSQGSPGFAVPAPDPTRQPGAAPAAGAVAGAPAEGGATGVPAAPGAAEAAQGAGGPTGQAPVAGAAAQSTTTTSGPGQTSPQQQPVPGTAAN